MVFKEKWNNNYTIIVLLLVFLLAGFAGGFYFFREDNGEVEEIDATEERIPVSTEEAEVRSLSEYTSFNASITPESTYYVFPQLSEEVDSIREEKMHLQDFSEMVGLLTEDKDHLSYSLAFRSYNTKDDLLLEDSSLIETDKLSIRDSYTYKIVNLHGMTEFKMILAKDIEDRFWDRIDVGLECEKTNETEYHKLLDCIVIQ